MKRIRIDGWKTYAVAVAAIVLGGVALSKGYTGDGIKGILSGCALIALRDAISKILYAIESNRRALDNMRAAVEAQMTKRS